MGFELRTIQRKFHLLMGEVTPQIKPRFVVWLDERLAEFKVKGEMNLAECLDDPQWIKDYNKSKRESRAMAIKERADRAGTSESSLVKVETVSESSNGLPADYVETQSEFSDKKDKVVLEESDTQQDFQLVEVKKEQLAEDDDDDMIIVGEVSAPATMPTHQTQSFSSPYMSYNPTRQLYSGLSKYPSFQRRRQRFGAAYANRSGMLTPFTGRLKSKYRQNFHSQPIVSSPYTSQSMSFPSRDRNIPSQTVTRTYEGEEESIQIPSHLQGQGLALSTEGDNNADESANYSISVRGLEGEEVMYTPGTDDSYMADTSYMTDPGPDQMSEEGLVNPVPGTSSEDPSTQDFWVPRSQRYSRLSSTSLSVPVTVFSHQVKLYNCQYCSKSFRHRSSMMQHVNYYHLHQTRNICVECGKTFPSISNLEGHINSVHLNIRPFICNQCHVTFFYKAHLQSHTKHCTGAKLSKAKIT